MRSYTKGYKNIFFAAYGFGPYECFFCRSRDVCFDRYFHIHHIDRNKKNNHPLNLAAAHPACHRRWHVLVEGIPNRGHGRGRQGGYQHWSPEQKAQHISRMTGSTNKSRTGQTHTAETREKISITRKAWWASKTPEERVEATRHFRPDN